MTSQLIYFMYVTCFSHNLPLEQGSPTLLLESYRPTDFISNPNQAHLNELIKVFKAEINFRQVCWSWNLQDGSSPGAGLEIPALEYKVIDFLEHLVNGELSDFDCLDSGNEADENESKCRCWEYSTALYALYNM